MLWLLISFSLALAIPLQANDLQVHLSTRLQADPPRPGIRELCARMLRVAVQRPAIPRRSTGLGRIEDPSLPVRVGQSIGFDGERVVFQPLGQVPHPEHVVRVLAESHFPYIEYIGEVWEYEGQKFHLINIGNRVSSVDRPFFQKVEEALFKDLPANASVEIRFEGSYYEGHYQIGRINRLREAKVFLEYIRRKPYLDNVRSYFDIEMSNFDMGFAHEGEVLVLLRGEPVDPSRLSSQEIYDRMVATLSITPAEASSAYTGVWSMNEMWFEQGHLPGLSRIGGESENRNHVRRQIQNALAGRRVCEATRYVVFDSIPSAVQERLTLRMFELLEAGGYQDLLADADDATSKLFRARYGMEEFFTLATHERTVNDRKRIYHEYYDRLIVGSERYNEARRRMLEKSSDVRVRPAIFLPMPTE